MKVEDLDAACLNAKLTIIDTENNEWIGGRWHPRWDEVQQYDVLEVTARGEGEIEAYV